MTAGGGLAAPAKTGEEEESVPAAVIADTALSDLSAPVGPSLEEETAFLAAERASGSVAAVAATATADAEEEKSELPPMEDLVNRIPAPTRELIENLFRARFVTVKRMPKAALKKS